MKHIDPRLLDLLDDQTRAFAFLGTIMPDGSPQVTPVWFNTDGDEFLINSAKGRVKDQNMRARPDVALAIMDLDDPYRYLQVRGTVVEITEEGALEHINILSGKYFGRPFSLPEGEIRVIYKIRPE
jgi:PPOX class probable F420-dependent enzyme